MQRMDDATTSLLQGLEEEATEVKIATEKACGTMLRDLETKNPQLMDAGVMKLNDINITIFYGDNSVESLSWKKYHHYWESRLTKQISSEIGKFLNKPVEDIDLKECLEIDRYAKNNQLNGICHAPKEEIDKIRRDWDDFRVMMAKETRDMFIQSINEQARLIGQSVLPEIRITLVLPHL